MPTSSDASEVSAPPAEAARAIEVAGVHKSFGVVPAVADVSFTVRKGAICGIVGSDGAGKTTLLRMIATLMAPDRGTIRVGGFDTKRERNRVKALMGYMPQRFGLYQDLSVLENIDFFMDIYGIAGAERKRRRERYLGFSNLLPFLNRRAGDLSGGMKQKLGLACVLVHEPRVLILDEPTNGVDPVSRKEFWEILDRMRRQGMSLLVSTAYLDEGEKCDRLVLMHEGRVLADATPERIRGEAPDLEAAMIRRIESLENREKG